MRCPRKSLVVAVCLAVSTAIVHADTPPVETGAPVQPIEIVAWSKAHPGLPVLAVGILPEGFVVPALQLTSRPRGAASGTRPPARPSLNTPGVALDTTVYPEDPGSNLLRILQGFGESRENAMTRGFGRSETPGTDAPPASSWPVYILLAAPFLPVQQVWIPDRLEFQDRRILLHATAWEGRSTIPDPPSQCLAFLLQAAHFAEGRYSLALTVDHVIQDADGAFHSTGTTQTGEVAFLVAGTGGSVLPWAETKLSGSFGAGGPPATLSTTVILPADRAGQIKEADLKKSRSDAKPSPASYRPLNWTGNTPYDAAAKDFALQVGECDVNAFLGSSPHRTVPEARAAGEPKASDQLYAIVTSPNLDRDTSLELAAVTSVDNIYTLAVNLWHRPTTRTGVGPTRRYIIVPLSFLESGRQTIAVKFIPRTMSTSYSTNWDASAPAMDSPSVPPVAVVVK